MSFRRQVRLHSRPGRIPAEFSALFGSGLAGICCTRSRPPWPGCPVPGRRLVISLCAGHPLPEHGMRGSHRPRRSCIRPGQAWRGIASDDHYDHVAMQPTCTAALAGFRPSSRHRLTWAWPDCIALAIGHLGQVVPSPDDVSSSRYAPAIRYLSTVRVDRIGLDVLVSGPAWPGEV